MCLIIVKPKGIEIPEDKLRNAWLNNNDGWGIMFAESGKLTIEKGLKYEDLSSLVPLLIDYQVVIHVRTATSGKKDLLNCHPFKVTDDIWYCHNGIFRIAEIDKTKSDTWHLAEYILSPLLTVKPSLFGSKELEDLISSFDKSSKFVLLRSDGELQIINERGGSHFEGLWISNTYSIQSPISLVEYETKGKGSKNTYTFTTPKSQSYYSDWESSWLKDSKIEDYSKIESSDYPRTLEDLFRLEYHELESFIRTSPQEVTDIIYESAYDWEIEQINSQEEEEEIAYDG